MADFPVLEATVPATARRLLEEALHLRANGERAPGGTETWQQWERKAEEYLRSQSGQAATRPGGRP